MMVDAQMVDVREYPEFQSGHIEGSKLVPLGEIEAASHGWDKTRRITLVCQSGHRAEQARMKLASQGFQHLTVLGGGIEAWKAAGKPLIHAEKRPWAMERQVRVVAGSLVLVFLALGYFIWPYFTVGAALVGAGLVFAGASNTCMMASVLGRMPWNRPPQVPA
jgi:rhodanese-related sulfurtransferase